MVLMKEFRQENNNVKSINIKGLLLADEKYSYLIPRFLIIFIEYKSLE
jgi:hypothetical protein